MEPKRPLHFIKNPGTGQHSAPRPPAPQPPAPPKQQPPPPPSLAHVEQTWLDTLEREAAKIDLTSAFPSGRAATAAEIGAVVAHAQQIERWYASFLPVARQLAAQGHGRLIERVNTFLNDMRESRAIYEKMQQDARASQAATAAYATKSNEDVMAGFTAMHDKRQAVFDEMNANWAKGFKA
jgi:hypothetical protein